MTLSGTLNTLRVFLEHPTGLVGEFSAVFRRSLSLGHGFLATKLVFPNL